FSARRDLRSLFPILAELPDQIERASDKNGVLGRCSGQEIVKRLLCVGINGTVGRMVRGEFTELGSRDGARGARLGEDNFRRVWEKYTGDFIYGFVAQRAVQKKNLAACEVFFPNRRQLARRARIVRAIDVDVR